MSKETVKKLIKASNAFLSSNKKATPVKRK